MGYISKKSCSIWTVCPCFLLTSGSPDLYSKYPSKIYSNRTFDNIYVLTKSKLKKTFSNILVMFNKFKN